MGTYVIPVRAKHSAEREVSPTGSDRWGTGHDSLVPPLLRWGGYRKME